MAEVMTEEWREEISPSQINLFYSGKVAEGVLIERHRDHGEGQIDSITTLETSTSTPSVSTASMEGSNQPNLKLSTNVMKDCCWDVQTEERDDEEEEEEEEKEKEEDEEEEEKNDEEEERDDEEEKEEEEEEKEEEEEEERDDEEEEKEEKEKEEDEEEEKKNDEEEEKEEER
ncbi:unnamed protein product, partial [Hydatigera taeniaeformis]|uniref:Ubiquitin-like domain-containing protein n=1 Tax=Hydatigena taeniaeformis TaxID=6205 RepID=A0A0R3X9M2_HYDTA